MARRRFFVPEVRRGSAELSGSDAEHLVRVLRAEPGQVYELSDNTHVYLAEIVTARKSSVVFKIREQLPDAEDGPEIVLLPALFKFDRFEWMIEKATELGVTVIQPMEATRTEHGLAQASAKRTQRWERIVLESSQQSRRAHLPEVRPTVRFFKSLETAADMKLLLDEDPTAPPLLQVLGKGSVALLLGPEGGWTDAEREQANTAGWVSCSLGQNVLRAETAAIAALASVQSAWAIKRREEQ